MTRTVRLMERMSSIAGESKLFAANENKREPLL